VSDYIERFRKRADDLLGTDVPGLQGLLNAIEHFAYHERDWSKMLKQAPQISQDIREVWQSFNFVDKLYEDIYNELIQGVPFLEPETDMRRDHRVMYRVTEGVHDDPRTLGLRLNTRHDPYATAMALISMKDRIKAALSQLTAAQAAADAEQLLQDALIKALQQLARDLRDLGAAMQKAEGAPDGSPEQQEAAHEVNDLLDRLGMSMEQAEQLRDEAQQQAQEAGQQGDVSAGAAMSELQQGLDTASREASEEASLMRSFGLSEGLLKKMDFKERQNLAKRLKNTKLAKFSKLVGQFRQVQIGEMRKRARAESADVVGVTLGDNLPMMTAAGLINVAEPELEDLFFLDLLNRRLPILDTKGSARLGRGPIVIIGDESSSMDAELNEHTREAWMKALIIAMAQQAKDERRPFHYIGFASPNEQWQLDMPDGPNLPDIVKIVEHMFDGGTYYEKPLKMALKLVQGYGLRNKMRPDIVFITDGEYRIHDMKFLEKWNEVKEALDLRCFGIVVGEEGVDTSSMDLLCDGPVRTIGSFTEDPKYIANLFREI